MNIKTRIMGGVMAAGLLGGVVAVAAPAGATLTVDRGTTQLMKCEDVSAKVASIKTTTGQGLGTTNRSVKVAGIGHQEKFAPGATQLAKAEGDPSGTPDLGDTDSCGGSLTQNNAFNPWFNAGIFAPYSPTQQLTTPINELVKLAGTLYGRTNCDTSGGPSPTDSWGLHGKLILGFGNQVAVGTLNTAASLDALGKKVEGQFYVNSGRTIHSDVITLNGIGIKGTGEGAWFDSAVNFGAPAYYLLDAVEACINNADTNADGTIGHVPGGGLQSVVTDTDVDTGLDFGTAPADYNNSMDISI